MRPAGRLDGAYWLIGPGSACLAQGCRCALPLQAWAGHIVAAARLQLVVIIIMIIIVHYTVSEMTYNCVEWDVKPYHTITRAVVQCAGAVEGHAVERLSG